MDFIPHNDALTHMFSSTLTTSETLLCIQGSRLHDVAEELGIAPSDVSIIEFSNYALAV